MHCLRFGCAALALAFTAPAQARDGDIIVTGRALDNPRGDAAFDSVAIDRARLSATASNRIEDALRDVAGLTQFRRSDSRSANATSQGATLRGLGGNASSRALVVLDGVPQSDPFGGWITWPALALERIARIRVTRGGGSVGFGSGALAGTIELDSIGGEAGSAAALAAGSRESLEASGVATLARGRGFGFVAGSVSRGDGFVPIISGQRGPVDRASPYTQASFAARAVIAAATDTEIQASLLGFRDRRERGTARSQNGGEGADASVRIVHRGRWGIEALGYVQLREFRSRFVAIDAARTTATQTVDQFSVPSTAIGGRLEVRPPLGERVELRIGGDTRRVRGETNEFFSFVAGSPTRIREAGGRNDIVGLFADGSAALGKLMLTGGIRADHWRIRNGELVERILATGALARNEIAPDRSGWETTGRAGAVWDVGAVSVRASAYLGWRLPTLNELYRPFRVGADATAANPALRPERMRGAEAGIKWDAAEGLALTTTAFANRLVRPIANVTLGRGPGTFPGVGFVAAGGAFRQRQNVDAIRSNGLELGLDWRSGHWRAQAGYALTDARVRASGTAAALNGLRPAQVPRHTASATIGWKGLSTTLRYVASQFEDDLNRRKLDDALTLDAVAALPLGKALSVSLRGENLFNARVAAAISAAGVIERATPRTLWIGLNWREPR